MKPSPQPPDLLETLPFEELLSLGIRPVRAFHKEKVKLHKERVDADLAQRNHDAKKAKFANDNRLIRQREEEDQRLYELACVRMANSAFHIDQVNEDTARRRRLAVAARNQRKREQRDAVFEMHSTEVDNKGPKSPLGGAMFTVDYVDKEKVAATMLANTRIVHGQLAAAKQQRKQIAAVILGELADTARMFPRLLSPPTSPLPAASPADNEKLSGPVGRHAKSTSPVRPSSFSPTATAAAVARSSPFSPWQEPLAEPSAYSPSSRGAAAGPGGAAVASGDRDRMRRPKTGCSSSEKRRQATGLSTRFDSPAVPLPACPGLPPLLDYGVYNT